MNIIRACAAGTIWTDSNLKSIPIDKPVRILIPIDGSELKIIKDSNEWEKFLFFYKKHEFQLIRFPVEIDDEEEYFIAVCEELKGIMVVKAKLVTWDGVKHNYGKF